MDNTESRSPIILFDGLCNFCSSIVQFAILRDPKGVFKFAPLQSATGMMLLRKVGLPTDGFDSFVFIEDNKYYLRSSAALKLFRRLDGLWPLLYLFMIIPEPLRDHFYKFIAKNRYRWFGKRQECFIPSPDISSRFL